MRDGQAEGQAAEHLAALQLAVPLATVDAIKTDRDRLAAELVADRRHQHDEATAAPVAPKTKAVALKTKAVVAPTLQSVTHELQAALPASHANEQALPAQVTQLSDALGPVHEKRQAQLDANKPMLPVKQVFATPTELGAALATHTQNVTAVAEHTTAQVWCLCFTINSVHDYTFCL